MQQSVFPRERTGSISATVQPSNLIPPGLGVFIQVNDHYDATKPETGGATQEIIGTLRGNFAFAMV